MGWLGGLFGNKPTAASAHAAAKAPDLSWMKMDMHSHVLPGIDDGAPDVEASLQLLRRYEAAGIQHVVATPHIRNPHFANTVERVRAAWEELEAAPERKEIAVSVSYSAEYYMDEVFLNMLSQDMLMPFCDDYLLTELSLSNKSYLDLTQIIQLIMAKGLQPILAHPERYLYWNKTPEHFAKLKAHGWLLQINLMSLAGYYGKGEQKVAQYLLENDLVDFVGTDVHREKHFDILAGIDDKTMKILEGKYLMNKILLK